MKFMKTTAFLSAVAAATLLSACDRAETNTMVDTLEKEKIRGKINVFLPAGLPC